MPGEWMAKTIFHEDLFVNFCALCISKHSTGLLQLKFFSVFLVADSSLKST